VGRREDLTHATLRSVSPIHIEYLQNMGVRASMSVSLLRQTPLCG
jgi:light-regulated signal transduction histidine kinase (bacteriophytochrome)